MYPTPKTKPTEPRGQFPHQLDTGNLVAVLNTRAGAFTLHPIVCSPAPGQYITSDYSAGSFPTKEAAIELAEMNGYEVINKDDDFSVERPPAFGPVRVFTNLFRQQFKGGDN